MFLNWSVPRRQRELERSGMDVTTKRAGNFFGVFSFRLIAGIDLYLGQTGGEYVGRDF